MDAQGQERVRQIIADELQRPYSDVRSGASLRKELGMDSVAAINIVFAIEDTFGVHVPETELEHVDDMDQIIALIRQYAAPA
jgi:acyl carrier protein